MEIMRTNTLDNWTPIVPVESKTRVNDSNDILSQLGWVSYTCETTGAVFYGATLEQAQVKAAEAIRLAEKHNRIITASSKFDPKHKPSYRPRNLPRVGAKVNRWTILTESYEKDGKFVMDAECECGNVETKTEGRFTGADQSRECTECFRKRGARVYRERVIAKLDLNFPIGTAVNGWEVIGQAFHDGRKYRIRCRCKCGYEKDQMSRRLSERTLGVCRKCSKEKKS